MSKNSMNKVIIYGFDETDCNVVFPKDDFDEAYLKMLNFTEVRNRIVTALTNALTSKEFSYIPHS